MIHVSGYELTRQHGVVLANSGNIWEKLEKASGGQKCDSKRNEVMMRYDSPRFYRQRFRSRSETEASSIMGSM